MEFQALDGEPVRVLLPLIAPTVKSHLQLISRLSFALRDAEFKALLDRQASRDELHEGTRRVSAMLETRTSTAQETLTK